jgi:hypothetical protein
VLVLNGTSDLEGGSILSIDPMVKMSPCVFILREEAGARGPDPPYGLQNTTDLSSSLAPRTSIVPGISITTAAPKKCKKYPKIQLDGLKERSERERRLHDKKRATPR